MSESMRKAAKLVFAAIMALILTVLLFRIDWA